MFGAGRNKIETSRAAGDRTAAVVSLLRAPLQYENDLGQRVRMLALIRLFRIIAFDGAETGNTNGPDFARDGDDRAFDQNGPGPVRGRFAAAEIERDFAVRSHVS